MTLASASGINWEKQEATSQRDDELGDLSVDTKARIVRPRYRLRLWLVALALFAAGFLGRTVLLRTADVAHAYPSAVQIQFGFYGAGLLVLAVSWVRSVDGSSRSMVGCLVWVLVAVICWIVILASVPK